MSTPAMSIIDLTLSLVIKIVGGHIIYSALYITCKYSVSMKYIYTDWVDSPSNVLYYITSRYLDVIRTFKMRTNNVSNFKYYLHII